jgi:NAD-dependent dihydropyrimidine dehydrogenase PreA subunit
MLSIWAKFGYELEEHFALEVDRVACKGCTLCSQVCPKGVFELYRLNRGQKSWVAHPADCEQCTACVKQCPEGAILADPPIRGFGRIEEKTEEVAG